MTAQVTMSRCRTETCQAPIVWVLTGKGKRNPLEGDPETGRPKVFEDNGLAGRIQQEHVLTSLFEDHADEIVVHMLGNGEEADPELEIWMSHFVTCPAAKQWRLGKGL